MADLSPLLGEQRKSDFAFQAHPLGQPTEPLLGTLSVYCEHDERVLDAIWRGER
jgi:hypothetical protein